MEELEDEAIRFGNGEAAIEEEEEAVEEEANTEEEVQDEETNIEQKEEPKSEPKPQKDSKQQALDYERSRRKQVEKELKELKAEREKQEALKAEKENIDKERENLRAKLMEGDLIDEDIANKLLDTIGEDLIKTKIAHQKLAEEENFEKEFAELKKDEMFMDADKYKTKIKEFVKKGLSLEEAYGASIPASRYANLRKDLEIEIEQKILNNGQKADKIDIGHSEAKGKPERTSYTKEEQIIAQETGLDVKEVHKRANMHTLDDFLELK